MKFAKEAMGMIEREESIFFVSSLLWTNSFSLPLASQGKVTSVLRILKVNERCPAEYIRLQLITWTERIGSVYL